MAGGTVEQDFAAFRATGDPDALGRVFDGVAPKLLLVAAHLAPRHADDLVQTTFVRAIERARSFDAARPLWPWLVGILALEAKALLRRETRAPDPARLAAEPSETPIDVAAAAETTERIAAAVDALPEPFRQVCALRLVHGLEPAQIARVLGIPAETARTRLHRGLERLRRSLPVGLASAVVLALPRDALASVRVRVLEVARSARPLSAAGSSAPTVITMAGVLTMKKTLWGLAGAVALVLAIPAVRGLETGVPLEEASAPAPVARAAPLSDSHDPIDPAEVRPQRVPVAATSPAPPTSANAVIRGRCVDESGVPLSSVAVALTGRINTDRQLLQRLEGSASMVWEDPPAVRTGTDGGFEVEFEPQPHRMFELRIEADDRLRLEGFWPKIDPGAGIGLGDVIVPRGVAVRGQVVDESGAPVPDRLVEMWTPPFGPGGGGPLRPLRFGNGKTDARGWFDIGERLPPGTYRIGVDSLLVREPAAGIAIDAPAAELRVVVAPIPPDVRPVIAGTVVDARGSPVARAEVTIDGSRFPPAYSDDTGEFELRRDVPLRALQQLRNVEAPKATASFTVTAAGCLPWRPPEPVPWGTTDLRIGLEPGPQLTIRAVRADDGTPIPRFGIVLAPMNQNGTVSREARLDHVGDHPGGLLVIPHVSPGRSCLSIVPPAASGLLASRDLAIDVEAGVARRVEVRLSPARERRVEIRTADGDPVAGVRVELLEHRIGGEVTLPMIAKGIEAARHNHPDVMAVLHDAATSDAGGRVVLRGPSDRSLALRLPGPGHEPIVVQPFDLTEAGPARIVVDAGATLRGRIGPASVIAMLRTAAGLPAAGPLPEGSESRAPALWLRGTGERAAERFPAGQFADQPLLLGEDGSFETVGVPAGTWQVQLRVTRALGSSHMSTGQPIGELVSLRPGEIRDIEVDLASWLQEAVVLEVHVDGRPFVGSLQLEGSFGVHPDGTKDTAQAFARTDREGKATVQLRPGRWDVIVNVPIVTGGGFLPIVASSLVVRRGAPQIAQVDVRTGRRAVIVLDSTGAPVPKLELRMEGANARVDCYAAPTDAAGRTTVHGTRGTVRVFAAGTELGTIELTAADGTPATLRLR